MNPLATSFPFVSRMLCLAFFVWNIALFILVIHHSFARPQGVPLMMRVLSVAGLTGALLDVALLATSAQASIWQIILGVCLLIVSQKTFRAARTAMRANPLSLAFSTDAPTFLNESGPYRWVRHPFYTAYAISWLAVCAITGHPAAAAVFVVMMSLYVYAAYQEERKFLQSRFAADYRGYQQRTGMFLPSHFTNTQPHKDTP